jgi:hypothetical protein
LYSAPNNIRVLKSRKKKLAGHVEYVGRNRYACRVWVGRPEKKNTFYKALSRWEANIIVNLKVVG